MAANNGEGYDHHRGKQPLLRPSTRFRTGLFLGINLAGFVAVNAFWQYLATGHWGYFAPRAYHTPLGETFIRPLYILSHPWMILVTGLLLGLVVMLPLVVSVLYRLLFAAVFVAVVAVVGHAPFLALFLAAGCVLAGRTPLRSDMPFLATVFGMIPIGVYMYFFAFAGVDSPAVLPMRKWVLYAPFVVAAVSAVVGSGVVLLLARLTGFRPGVVWPVLAVLLAAPVTVFYAKIGTEELDYAILTAGVAPGDAIFDPVPLDVWKRSHGGQALNGRKLEASVRAQMLARRDELLEKCDRDFLDKHPDGRRAPSVLWLKAQCASLQLDGAALRGGLVRYTASPCLSESATVWLDLREQFHDAPQAALAYWRLGELAAREGAFHEGYRQLLRAAKRLERLTASSDAENAGEKAGRVFEKPRSLPDPEYYSEALVAVERLIWLIKENHILSSGEKAERTKKALTEFLAARPDDRETLAELETRYAETHLADNLSLAVALATREANTRAARLLQVARLRDGEQLTDAAIAANYELGLLATRADELRRLHRTIRTQLNSPEEYFRTVIEAGQQPWKRRAEEYLARLRRSAETRAER